VEDDEEAEGGVEMDVSDEVDGAAPRGDDDDDDDDENEFNDDNDDIDDDDEVDGKSSVASGSPTTNSNVDSGGGANKRQRSNTPPLSMQPKLDTGMKLASNLLLLNGSELGHIVSILEQQCPAVLESYDHTTATPPPPPPGTANVTRVPERMEINVDLLMEQHANVFNILQQYIHDHINKKRAIACMNSTNVKVKDISNRRKERKT
jgi:hypothetical protein